MKKIVKAVLFLAAIAVSGILIFEYSYKLTSDDFITDRTTFIYSNKNINREKLKKFEETFNIENITEKEILKKVKSICLLSQSKIYSSDINVVGIADTGLYYPVMFMKIKKYFDVKDGFYKLKDEYKEEIGIPNSDVKCVNLTRRGLFFAGTDTGAIDKVIHSSQDQEKS